MDCGSEETNAAVHNMTSQVKVALGVGAGDAIGAAYARRFAAGGYAIAIARRDASKSAGLVAEIEAAGGVAKAYSTDARDEQSVQALFESVERDLGPVEVCLYNAGANYRAALLDTTAEMFEKVWRLGLHGWVFDRAVRRRGTCLRAVAVPFCLLGPQPACEVVLASLLFPPLNGDCAPLPSRWLAS